MALKSKKGTEGTVAWTVESLNDSQATLKPIALVPDMAGSAHTISTSELLESYRPTPAKMPMMIADWPNVCDSAEWAMDVAKAQVF